MIAGFVGGVVGAWMMNEFQSIASEVQEKEKQRHSHRREQQSQQDDSDDATMKAADKLSQLVTHHPLTKQQKKEFGPVVHYAFGGAMGALYGATAAIMPAASTGFGTLFGAALFLFADEAAVPALGLSKKPQDYPASSHAMALASHLVWGTTTEAVRRLAA
jgi:putative membrane protein